MIKYGAPYSYKQICELMNDEVNTSGGKGRLNQLKKWQQFYDIEKIGAKYYIYKQYSEEEQQLVATHGKYTTYVENLLVHHLKSQDGAEVTMTYREILELLCMVNDKYYPTKNGIRKAHIKVPQSMDESIVDYNKTLFFDVSSKLLKRVVDNALDQMEERSIITRQKSYRLYKQIKGENGVDVVIAHDCTTEELSKFLTIQYECMKSVGITTKSQLFSLTKKQRDIYYDNISKRLKEVFGFDRYAQSVKMVVCHDIKYRECFSAKELNAAMSDKLLTSKAMKVVARTINDQLVADVITV